MYFIQACIFLDRNIRKIRAFFVLMLGIQALMSKKHEFELTFYSKPL